MTSSSWWRSRRVRVAAAVCVGAALVGTALWLWRDRLALPRPGSKRYEEYVLAFEKGTAALDAGSFFQREAEQFLTEAIGLVPEEPAGWANRGLLYIRMNQLGKAAPDLRRAIELVPGNADVEESLSLLAEANGKIDEAIEHMEKAAAADPSRPARLFSLVRLAQVKGGEGADELRHQYLERLVEVRPNNLLVLMDRALLAARRHDDATLRDTLTRLGKLAPDWSPERARQWTDVRRLAEAQPDSPDVSHLLQRLKHVLADEPGYRRGSAELDSGDANLKGVSMQQLIRLAPIRSAPDPPDRDLTFYTEASPALSGHLAPGLYKSPWMEIVPAWLGRTRRPVVFVASATEVRRLDAEGPRLTFPGGAKSIPPGMDGVLSFDWDNDYRNDFLLAGAGGLRFYLHQPDGSFKDATAASKLPDTVLKGDYQGAWAVDIDQDGDLDVLLARRTGAVLLLRNNGNGTFKEQAIFPAVADLRGFAWIDLDNDGACDAVLLDATGRLHVFMNERSGQFRRREAPAPDDRYLALCAADLDDDGLFDVVAVRKDGAIVRHSDRDKGKGWESAELAKLTENVGTAPGECRLSATDIDNNGALDLVFRTARLGFAWLADGRGDFSPLAARVPPGTAEIFSAEEGGEFDFWEIASSGGAPVRHVSRPTRGYGWRVIRPRATPNAKGDQRVNAFGLGGEVEVRSGSLVLKQPVSRPVVLFGLGSRRTTPVVRVVWTNGTSQTEFTNPAGAVLTIEQRLSSSCPFLFSFDGEKMVFVADFLWSSPLGMYINGQDRGGLAQTTDWKRIRSDQLAPRNGIYDLRVNANLWETHFIDHLALKVIDHPPGTEMFVDERFFLTPTKPQFYLTEKPRPVARALDHNGKDVTEIVRRVDGRYLDRAGRGAYQGITREHWVEIDLGDDAPTTGPVYLLAHGFIHPTDSSINFAVEQNPDVRPRPLSLEVPDGKGGWKVGRPALGFPAGKNKTVVLRLDGIDGKGVSRRVRLRTNLEIHWDALEYARGLDASVCQTRTLLPDRAELRYRGILGMTQDGPGTPELPHYDEVSAGQVWRDLIGFHTRFGEVHELVEKVDDRYVIMNAGDELLLQFKAPGPPKAGWKRDFVWVADGWEKDGNLNTRFSKTVLPLPYHGMPDYLRPPGRLEDDPVFRRFPGDWVKYHTRHITPAGFEKGLRNFRRPGR